MSQLPPDPATAAALAAWTNPWQAPGRWYKGNLHTHTTGSDGKVTPEQAMEFFRSQGFDFLGITDHGKVTPVPEWPYPDLLTIPGLETDGGRNRVGNSYHIVALGTHQPLPTSGMTAQQVLDAYREAGGLAFVAHPYWSDMAPDDLLPLTGHTGLEVYNTGCDLEVGKGISSVHWDQLLIRGARWNALAVDDCHWNPGCFDAGQGWVMVRSPQLTRPAILAALAQGLSYSSRGPAIEDLRLQEGRLAVVTSPVRRITFMCEGAAGEVFEAPPGSTITRAEWEIRPRRYVRVECEDERGRQAWSNPIYLGAPAP